MSALTPELTAFLTAVRDALDIPLADITTEDDRVRALLMDRRASNVLVMVDSVLTGDDPAAVAKQLLAWTAEKPVTYTVWVPKQTEGGEPR